MTERVEAATNAISKTWLSRIPVSDRDTASKVLAAADAVMFSDGAVERAARATYAEGAYCGGCEFAGWDTCPDCRRCNMDYARAAIATLKGGDE